MVVIDRKTEDITELIEIPPTVPLPPKPPKVIQPILIEVQPEEIIEEIEYTFDANEIEDILEIETTEIEPPEVVDKIFTIVEVMPEPLGGLSEFFEFVYKEIKYPNTARRMGIDGRITIQFIIDKDGSLTNFHILSGIGAGCDEEVLRVLKMAPKWKPGKQRGIPVRVKMALPITFRLN
ncbi:MAG: energy transducer TonB [Bacteroidetes bacterium]|nr:energy transducer TonB [Bacteroidota bacterium]